MENGTYFLTEAGMSFLPDWGGPVSVTFDPTLSYDLPPASVAGLKAVATFDSPIEELRWRRGRLTAKVGGMWRIVPTP